MASRMLHRIRTTNTAESGKVRVPVTLPASFFPPNPRVSKQRRPNQTTLMLENHANFSRSRAPTRFMFFQDGSWVDFSADVLASVRSAFLARKPVIDLLIDGSKYLFDFMRMLQVDFETEHQRSVAWIDVTGNCFFPKSFVAEESWNVAEESSELPRIEIEIRIDGNSVKRKREEDLELELEEENRVIGEEVEVSSSHKEKGLAKRACLAPGRWSNAVELKEGDESYLEVEGFFRPGIDSGSRITAIHRCERNGHLEKARYEVFMKQAEIVLANRGASNMVYAWYGASGKDAVASILAHGFAVPVKDSRLERYGVGVHLSPVDAPHSSERLIEADTNGEKHLILCRVILGNVEPVEAGSEQFLPSHVNFDTGSDNPSHPKWYVVWRANMNSHILPEYVVSYKPPSPIPGPCTTPASVKYTVAELFGKMKAILSAPKFEEALALYNTFKAGNLAKCDFIKQLRLVAGDKMLLSAMKEIRGC